MYEERVDNLEKIVKESDEWRAQCINLIASENVTSKTARKTLISDLGCRYAEHSGDHYYYRGTKPAEKIENELEEQLKSLFQCKNAEVRPISGTLANDIVFSVFAKGSHFNYLRNSILGKYIGGALDNILSLFAKENDKVMAYTTNAGGHISHYLHGSLGKYTKNIIPIPLADDKYHLDVDETAKLIKRHKPSLIVLGKSLFLFPEPIKELRKVCDKTGTKIVYDASHVLGLIAGKQFQNPIAEGADIVTASTHKTFPGTQRGIVLSNMDEREWKKIDKAAFPGALSNHQLNTLAGNLMATYEMQVFGEEYAKQIIKNAKTLANKLYESGFDVQGRDFGFTESHQVAVNFLDYGGGEKVARLLEDNNIILNSNLLPTEEQNNCKNPSGVREGVQEMTRVGMKEQEMEYIAELEKECLHGKNVREEVIEFRKGFQDVKYCFDSRS
jgi:glycine hydroxymethyltransferase